MNKWEDIGNKAKDYFKFLLDNPTYTQAQVAEVQSSLDNQGFWQVDDEWRISTYTTIRIEKNKDQSKYPFALTVSSDMQTHSFQCASLERALLYSQAYQHIITYSFYGLGPPWI